MASFIGHALPGSLFLLLSLWWTINILNCMFSRRKTNERFRSTLYYPIKFCGEKIRALPLEPFLRLLAVGIGASVELVFEKTINATVTHVSMYIFFALASFVDLFNHFHWPIPDGLSHLLFSMAFFMEGMLFYFHLHGRDRLDVSMHMLMVYTIMACGLVTLVETKFRRNALVALTRCYFMILQGTWFWQVGYILYNPFPGATKWDPKSDDSLMMVAAMFTWHCGAVFIFMFFIGMLVYKLHSKQNWEDRNGINMVKPLIDYHYQDDPEMPKESDSS